MLKICLFIFTLWSVSALACGDISGAYVHHWEASDVREGYCLDVSQIDCDNVQVVIGGVRYKNGKVYANNKDIFPDYKTETSKVQRWLTNGWFETTSNSTCKNLNY